MPNLCPHRERLRELSTSRPKGALLAEAQRACDHGAWLRWLEDEFEWSHDTAMNYIAAHGLAEKFRTVRNLKVPTTIIYELGGGDLDDPELPAIIEALAEATKGRSKQIERASASRRCDLAHARAHREAHLDDIVERGFARDGAERAIVFVGAHVGYRKSCHICHRRLPSLGRALGSPAN
jgi:hypothetical protein